MSPEEIAQELIKTHGDKASRIAFEYWLYAKSDEREKFWLKVYKILKNG